MKSLSLSLYPLARVIQFATALTVIGFSGNLTAQQTSSEIKGIVSDANGNPIANATITIMNASAGFTRTISTRSDGQFRINNLPIHGDYTVTATGDGYKTQTSKEVSLYLGETTDLQFALAESESLEEVIVYVTRDQITNTAAVGPSASFDLAQLQTAPAINRNLTDVIRLDPRVYVDESRGSINAVQCGGKNSRFNSLTVDGVRMNDAFGLNSNGYPTERMPFSYDAINQVAVELAPFDVEYGGFTACNINAVTKSGGNRFSGSVFYDYTSDSLQGDSLEGEDIEAGAFDETRFGFTLGGPIIPDRLFFFAAYEKLEGANVFDRGALGSGAVNEVQASQAELDEIAEIARTLYQYDPGNIPSSLDNEDEKLLIKFDANLSDTQRLSVTYNYNDGNNFTESDDDLYEIEFSNHLYERGAELESWVATLYSDWTENFSTEVRLGYLELDNWQNSIGGTDFGEIRVELDEVDVYLGGDDSRHSNDLDYDVTTFAVKGKYLLEDHSFSFGYEREALNVFNLFVQHTETEIRFDGIDNFRNGFADAIYYNNAPSGKPEDAAADWGYEFNTVYFQDEISFGYDLNLVLGLRYDWYTTDDEPVVNDDFVADYGFGNDQTLDGEGLLQPRLGFTYHLTDQLTLHGGIGLFSGGNPNVWLSNNYSNNNVLQFGQRGRSFGYTDGSRSLFDSDVVYAAVEDGAPAGPGYGIPQELYDAVAAGEGDNNEINYLDPDFKLPSEWKVAFGGVYVFDNNYVVNADLLFTRTQDSAIVLRGDLERTGTNDDGYPIYSSVREPSFVLTNADEDADSYMVSLNLSKRHDNGLHWNIGYAFSDAEDIQPMNSSVAFSNYQNRAFFDPQEQVASTSSYNIKHRFTANLNYTREFIDGYATRISLFLQSYQGPSYSYTVSGNGIYNFTPYLEGNNVLLPGSERNEEDGSWWTKADLRIEQELPGISEDHRASAYVVIDNLTNLLNDEWGVLRQVDFPGTVEPGNQEESRIGEASLYQVRFGLSYNF